MNVARKNSFLLLFILGDSMYSMAQFKNSKVAESGLQPAITINHKNPKNIIVTAGTNLLSFTKDGGTHWKEIQVQSPYGVFGNASLLSSTKGEIFFFHLTDPEGKGKSRDRIVCQTSDDGGQVWSLGSSIGNNPPKEEDQPRAFIHPKKNSLCITWTEFDKYGSGDSTCQSTVQFSQSPNGTKWSKPVKISQVPGDCRDQNNSVGWSMPVMDGDKKMFIVWSGPAGIFLDRSYDHGDTWLTSDMAAVKKPGNSLLSVPGLKQCRRIPILAIDNSDSFFRNSLYLVWADQRNGENDTDIWFLRSTNRGDYWTTPLRINKDAPGKHQFMPWMVVDPTTGVIYIVYYDRRNYDDLQTDVYLAYYTDGGDKFTEIKISEKPFVPTAEKPFGDHINMSVDKGVIAPVWFRMDEGKTSLWTAIIKQAEIISKESMPKIRSTRGNTAPRPKPAQNPKTQQNPFQRK